MYHYTMAMTILSSADPILIGLILISAAMLVILGLVIWMWLRQRKFILGLNAHNIEDSLTSVSSDLGDLKAFREELETYLATVEKRLRKSVRSVHIVRFNPWQGQGHGGDQSFATAFMNEEGNGVLISSLYSRDHVSIFGKPIKKHVTEHELSEEERRAIEEAKKGLKDL